MQLTELAETTVKSDQIQNLIKAYLDDHKDPKELLNQCIQRSRNRYSHEYSKLSAYFTYEKFFTPEGTKERQQSLKYKVLVKQRHPEVKDDKDIKNISEKDRALSMLLIHNSKVEKIIQRYKDERGKKQRAQEQGLTLKELEEKEAAEEKPTLASAIAKKKKVVKKKNDFEVVIKMKDEDGKIMEYDKEQEPIIESENTL